MPEDNKAIVHRFEKAFAANDAATLDELGDPNLVDHNPVPGQNPGLTGFKETVAMYKSIFPDSSVNVEEVIGEGDLVATRWTVTGTQEAEFFGIPATGKRATVGGMNFYRLTEGKITDVWTQFDGLGLMEQLGASSS
jgi:steroid delta-isomerase-like uncharacterized protein